MEPTVTTSPAVLEGHTLLLTDWKADPHAVVAACARPPVAQTRSFDLVVTAALHGIDWVGDPYANLPCAGRALDELRQLLTAAGLQVVSSKVGDHDPVAAAVDAALSLPVEQILVCGLKRHVRRFDLGDRVSRATHLPVVSRAVPASPPARVAWSVLHVGECGVTARASNPTLRVRGGLWAARGLND